MGVGDHGLLHVVHHLLEGGENAGRGVDVVPIAARKAGDVRQQRLVPLVAQPQGGDGDALLAGGGGQFAAAIFIFPGFAVGEQQQVVYPAGGLPLGQLGQPFGQAQR